MSVLEGSIQLWSDSAANFSSDNPTLLAGQIGIETDGLTTTPLFKIGDGSTAWNSLPYGASSSIPVNTCLFVMANGSNTTGARGRFDKPFLTITAAQTAAISGDTIFIFAGQTYTDTGLGKDGVTYHYLGSPSHTVASGVLYETGAGITFTVLGDGVFNAGASAVLRSLTSSSNNITFKCKSITRSSGGASAVVCNEGVVNVEATEFISSDTNCVSCANGTLTVRTPKYIGGGSSILNTGTGTIYSYGRVDVSSTAAELRAAILTTSTGKVYHNGQITYSNPNAIAGIIHMQIGTGAYVQVIGDIIATSFNATYGVVYLPATNATFEHIGRIIGTKTLVIAGSGAKYLETILPSQAGNSGKYLTTDGTDTSWGSVAAGGTWGSITGTLSNQTDLQNALNAKSDLASPTFTGTVTTPAIIVSSETASRVAIIDSSKNVKSADTATYPSLTELAYAKGVTSAIQTQLDLKAATTDLPKSAETVRYTGTKRGQNFIANGPAVYTTSGGYNGLLLAIPYVIGKTHYVTGIEFEVVTGVVSGKARLSLYADNGGIPGTLIEYAGEADCSTTGVKTINFSSNRLLSASDQIVWMAIEVNSGTIAVRYIVNPINVLNWNSAATTATSNIYTVAQSYGSSPSPFTAGAFKVTGGWGIDVRLVSLNNS